MLRLLRKIMFYVFVALYLVVTPYVILYALGYSINPKEKAFVKTGLISVVSVPRGAGIFVQGRKFSHRTPAVINDLLPGRYHVRLQRKGYEPWEREIEILPEKATQIEPALLLPQKPEREIISLKSYRGMIPEIIDSKMIVWQTEKLNSLSQIDLFFKKETPVRVSAKIPEKEEIKEVYAQTGSGIALLKTENGKTGFWLLQPDAGEKKELRDLTSLIQDKPDFFDWDPKNDSHLFYLAKGDLYRLDLQKESFPSKIASGVLGFGARYDRLVILKNNFSLVETDLRGLSAVPLLDDAVFIQKIFAAASARYYRIKILERNLFVFLSDDGTLVSNRMPYYLVDQDVAGVEYFSHGGTDKLLYWTPHEIGTLDFARTKQSIFEKGPERKVLATQGRDIRQAFWAYEDTHVVLLDENQIYLLETRGLGPSRPAFLENAASESSIYYSDRTRSLYFLQVSSRHLMKRKLGE
ncbi:MAG: PEGA domain-containing protein [Candidatus Omnitrophica bacterium]|nr:PEGA domain-containing protein [Candidatus Omnitrophota bacterium]